MEDTSNRETAKVVVLGDIGRSPRMQYHALSLANNGIKNPPAIPTLPVCRFYCLITQSKFIIDWHNYAYSIMALSHSVAHPIVRIAKNIEHFFGQSSNHNLCVTYAMKEDLLMNWNIMATVLYDRPPKIFHPITLEDKHSWFLKLGQEYPEFGYSGRENLNDTSGEMVERTAFTMRVGKNVEPRVDRPGLLFSSTSWTPDEDFGLLMDALQVYETTYELSKKLPKLICVITGKGPMKDYYLHQIKSKDWQHIKVITPWLIAADYPKMVASADLGVCLHTSSSGLDLPMKVVDMFGAGLPVCAFDFLCLNELVENGINGYTFKNSDQLAKEIVSWFHKFPTNDKQNEVMDKMRKELTKFQQSRWEDNWNLRAKKYFTS